MPVDSPELGELFQKLKKDSETSRPCWTIDGAAFTAKSRAIKGALRMRVLEVWEQVAAMSEAAKTAKSVAMETGLDSDPDFVTNFRTACALHRACLQPDRDIPAFPSAVELMKVLTNDELAMLMAQYTNVLRLGSPGDAQLDAVKAEGLSAFLAAADPNESIKHLLENFTPAYLALLSVLLSVKVSALVEENKSLRATVQVKEPDVAG